MIKGELYARLLQFREHFEKNAIKYPSFRPEAIACSLIMELLESLDRLELFHVKQIAAVIMEVDKEPHYDGVAWMDFKMHLNGLFRQNELGDEWQELAKLF